jgi:hypothetical protein
MTYPEFIAAVAEMRLLQKSYFQTRNRSTLDACKFKERQVDQFIATCDRQYNPPLIQIDLLK